MHIYNSVNPVLASVAFKSLCDLLSSPALNFVKAGLPKEMVPKQGKMCLSDEVQI
jgi:hypothetical protein